MSNEAARATPRKRLGPKYTWRWFITMPFIETIVSALLGGALWVIDKQASTGFIAFAIGLILGFSRLAFTQTLKRRLGPLTALTKHVDISRQISTPKFLEIMNIYLQILEPDFRLLKNAIVEDAAAHLQQLAQQKRSRELATSEYYHWLYSMLEQARPGGEIWAVSTVNQLEWDDSPPEQKFVQHNKDAVARGVKLKRIFIVKKGGDTELEKLDATSWHFSHSGDVEGYIVVREDIEKKESALLREIGDGFIAFDDRVAMIDVFSSDGSARGYVTMNEQEIRTRRLKFEQLLTHGDLRRIITPTNALEATPLKALPSP